MKVLVFAPHPDDESIGMGGTIYKHTQRGDEVAIAIMTTGNIGSLEIDPKRLEKTREKEVREACKVLGKVMCRRISCCVTSSQYLPF